MCYEYLNRVKVFRQQVEMLVHDLCSFFVAHGLAFSLCLQMVQIHVLPLFDKRQDLKHFSHCMDALTAWPPWLASILRSRLQSESVQIW